MLDLNGIWAEKYRPKTLDDLIISQRVRDILNDFRDNNEIPNLLFTGSPGTGKTTTARILVEDVLKCNYLYINASDESGIDTIRTKVVNFAQTKSFDGGIKVIILDEVDGTSIASQGALRNTMESYSKYVRFILTANYKHKIIPAIQSRCQYIDIKPVLEESVKRCFNILKLENVEVEESQKRKFVELIKANFPDLRKCINELQKNCINNTLAIVSITTENEVLQAIQKSISTKDVLSLRKYLIENEDKFYGDYDNLLKDYLNYLYNQDLDELKKKAMIAIIAEHLYRAAFVLDREVNTFACWIALENV
jgi:DNA polymerase III delta prime subunit